MTDLTFTHHPRAPLPWEFDPSRKYEQTRRWAKPTGFWLSVNDDWRRYCEADEVSDCEGVPVVEFALDLERVLVLDCAADLDEFHGSYVVPQEQSHGTLIDWGPLTEHFTGIMIAPYIWSRRLDGPASSWYYPWDCASACIWDLSAVTLAENNLATGVDFSSR
jgi:hypothetical protein